MSQCINLSFVHSAILCFDHHVKVAGAVQPLSCCCGGVSRHCNNLTWGHAWSPAPLTGITYHVKDTGKVQPL